MQLADAVRIVRDAIAAEEARLRQIADGTEYEHILLEGDPNNMIRGTVDVSEMMGSAVHLHLQACGKDTIIIVQTMDLQDQSALAMGKEIAFTFGGNMAHVFDKNTGKNLEF